MSVKGYVSSIQSMGTLDGPGVRFVAFLQGCNLRCGCCHNPETQSLTGGTEYSACEIAEKASKYKSYFGKWGGITLSGGEPILQAEFATEIFKECKKRGINTCLDTSGSVLNKGVKELLSVTDRVLLDIKYATDEAYRAYVGCSISKPLEFLGVLDKKGIPTTVRQVTIPTLNATPQDVLALKALLAPFSCVDRIELLPFRKICQVKYDQLGLPFPFAHIPTPTPELMTHLNSVLDNEEGTRRTREDAGMRCHFFVKKWRKKLHKKFLLLQDFIL
jgi:pyruvate formate lyase activating enzyme